ncbi:MAG: hypothetical protein B7733_10315 [Myxococcales bacterium FL481]|nr:MAG: hypothetical protein B7733_10315 [Myxococcales bacterium FL481]
MSDDPRARRQSELIDRTRRGEAVDHEHEELALYVGEAERDRLAAEGRQRRELGGRWLARSDADQRAIAVDENGSAALQRRVGLVVLAGGAALSVLAPVAGSAIALAGLGWLVGTLVRTRLAAARHDPYRHLKR